MTETESHPLKHWLDSFANSHPNAPAIYIEDEEIDYRTLKDQADALVSTLNQAGIKTGHHLALVTYSVRIIALMAYAAPHMGITFLPLDPRLPSKWQNSLLKQAGIEYVLCDNEVSDHWVSDVNVITIGQLLLQQFNLGKLAVETSTSIYTPLMLATSGSTDIPKVVLLTPENISASVHNTNQHLELLQTDLWLDCLPLFHIAGLMILYRCIAQGAAVVLHDSFNAEKVWHDLHQHPVTHLSLVPTMLLRLLEQANEAPPPDNLKSVLIGGAPLDPELAQRAIKLGWPLYMTYGMTETASQIASHRMELSDCSDQQIQIPVKLYENIEIQIRDNDGQVCEGTGHIVLRGAQVMNGYANPNKQTGQGLDQEGWLLTSDMGQIDENRNLRVIGRADEVIISGGEKIHPAQVESLMTSCPGIDEVAVIGQQDKVWGNILMAVHVGEFDEKQVEHWCHEQFKGSWRPRLFKRMDSLPRLANGKLDRKALGSAQL